MARIKIDLPASMGFETIIPVRITDLNYGNHVGNDAVLSIIHEARVAFLKALNYSEMDLGGVALIMADTAIVYKKEIFYPSSIRVSVGAGEFSRMGFDLFYKLEVDQQVAVIAKTGMVCFNYQSRKPSPLPEEAQLKLSSL